MSRFRRLTPLASLLAALALLAALVPAAPAAARAPAAPAAQNAPPGLSINYGNRVVFLPLARRYDGPPPPPAISADLFLRPVPLQEVQRGAELSVEYRYTNTGTATTGGAPFSLYYPQRLALFENASLPTGDSLVGYDGTRVIVSVGGVAPGETRRGRLNFYVRREAALGELLGLYATYDCQLVGVPCRSNLAEVEVIANDDEGGGQGGTFAMTVSPDQGPPGTAHTFSGSFFRPGEQVVTWMNTSSGAYPLPVTTTADNNGNIRIVYGTGGLVPGYYSLVAHGQRSNTEGVGAFVVTGSNLVAGLDAGPAALAGGIALPAAEAPAPVAAPLAFGAGGIAGHVTDSAGAGVAGVPIEVRSAAGDLAATAVSRADGTYFVASGLAAGSYTVSAAPARRAPDPALRFLGGASSGPVAVAPPEITRGVNLVLPPAGAVSGVALAGGQPLAGVRVSARGANGAGAGVATSGADGRYLVANLVPGQYTLVFDPRGAAGAGGFTRAEATVAVRAGEITPDSTPLRSSTRTGAIAGRVVDAAGGAAIPDVTVVFANLATGIVAVAQTESDGSYASDALPAGEYKVQFLTAFSDQPATTRYVGEYYADAASYAAAASVAVTPGQTTANVDAGLAQGGSIAGRVTGDGAGLAGVSVVAFGADGRAAALATSDATGAYSLRGLAAGGYTVQFITSFAADPATRAYADAPYDTTPPADPTVVAVAAGQAVSGVDQALGRGVQVVGTVTAADTGAGLAGVYTVVYDAATGRPVAAALSDAAGAYATGGLGSGVYKARFTTIFSPNPAARTYVDEYFSNRATLAEATPFTVGRNLGTRVLNAELAVGGSISGRVTASGSGAGLGGVVVVARQGAAVAAAVSTDGAGSYTLPGLATGSYSMEFITATAPNPRERGYAGELYPTPVTVAAGQDTPAIDAELAPRP